MKKLRIILTIGLIFGVTTVFAANDGWGKLGGHAYINYSITDIGQPAYATGFQIERMYLKYEKSLNKVLSFKLITDVGQVSTVAGDKTKAYTAFIKNAYVKYKQSFGILTVTSMLGMIPIPIIKGQLKHRGFRWVSDSTFHDITQVGFQSSEYKDTTADLGIWLSFEVAKMITITGAITNGDGFTDISNAGKDNYYDYSIYTDIRPLKSIGIKELFVNGYFKYDADPTLAVMYFGGGAGWCDSSLKAGANYIAFYKDVSTFGKGWQHVIDLYVNINTKKWIGLPILALVRGGIGINSDMYVKGEISDQILPLVGAGLGYSFGQTLNTMVYYEYKLKDHNVYIKLEVKI